MFNWNNNLSKFLNAPPPYIYTGLAAYRNTLAYRFEDSRCFTIRCSSDWKSCNEVLIKINRCLVDETRVSMFILAHLSTYCSCYVIKTLVSFPPYFLFFSNTFHFRPYIIILILQLYVYFTFLYSLTHEFRGFQYMYLYLYLIFYWTKLIFLILRYRFIHSFSRFILKPKLPW